LKFAYAAEAARPDADTKQKYFEEYLKSNARPEDWIEQSLAPFNSWNQAELTNAYLKKALDALPQIKEDRRIFFLGRWLAAFIGGQRSETARDDIHRYLNSARLDKDLRLKVLEAVDELDRTLAIRRRFPE
jgi:aminopeptidase N